MGKSIKQLWEENKKKVPFKVRRVKWSITSDRHIVVQYVNPEGENGYGKAFGYVMNGNLKEVPSILIEKDNSIGCAGTYQWEFYEE